MSSKTIPQFAAAIAGLGLVLSSFAIAMPAAAQTTTFTRDLTIGASGADVTALQNWLISKGFSIPAGATGYFGTQTQAAVAAYQAANGITPAAGYFGPITRAKVNAGGATSDPSPAPNEEDDEEDMTEREEAAEAIEDARDALSDARDEVEEADDDGKDVDEAENLLDEAEGVLEDAEEAYEDEDFDEAIDLVAEAEDLIEEALDEIGNDNDNDDDEDLLETSAELNRTEGEDSDSASFEITFDIEAFNQDAYISRDPSTSFEYQIEDGDGNVVSSSTNIDENLDSTADRSGNYYLIREDGEEEFTFVVEFNPLPQDEGKYFRLRLLGVHYNDTAAAPDQEWTASSKYRTDYVRIPD